MHANLTPKYTIFHYTDTATYSTFLAHSGGLLRVMKAQLVRIVNMINMLNIVGTKSRNTTDKLLFIPEQLL